MKYTLYQESRIGGRKANQDRIGHAYSDDAIVMALADGMGGHARGEVAAQLLVDTVLEYFQRLARPRLDDPTEFLLDSIYTAHERINEYAIGQKLKDTPRTTCVVCVIQGGRANWAHVGDSRLYHFNRDALAVRTLDHSAVQQLLEEGQLSEEEIAGHPDRNKLYNSVGGFILPNIDLSPRADLHDGDVLLLASDGFWTEFRDDEMLGTLRIFPVRQALVHMLDLAEYRAGGNGDNLSVMALRCGAEPSEVPDTLAEFGLEGFTTELRALDNARPRQTLSDGEIDQAIAEIQAALEKHHLK
jgi:serine/threonine protein phosphatase PrpC